MSTETRTLCKSCGIASADACRQVDVREASEGENEASTGGHVCLAWKVAGSGKYLRERPSELEEARSLLAEGILGEAGSRVCAVRVSAHFARSPYTASFTELTYVPSSSASTQKTAGGAKRSDSLRSAF